LGIAVGRVGAFLDGYGQGLPSDLPWASQYTSQLMATPDFGVPRHPAQLYDALVAVALYLLIQRLPENWRASVFLALYATARLALGAVRLDPAFLFGFQIEQLLATGTLVVGIVYGLRSAQRAARPAPRRVPQPSDPVAV
jgi:prolipoprotein diacylglyceryltransferase